MPKHWLEIDYQGFDEVIQQIRYVRSEIQSELGHIMLRAALIVEAEVKRLITNYELVDTGALRASVHSFVREQFNATEGVVGTNMEYAPFLEYGTGQRGQGSNHPDVPADYRYGDSRGIRAYKYMWTAWENKADKVTQYVNTELERLVS